jgi:lysyl-tRNA synthetase, class II
MSLDELLAQRRANLQKFRDAGVNPFPTRYECSHTARKVLQAYENLGKEDSRPDVLSVAGRLVTRRLMGKAAFAHLQDRTGKIQIYLRQDDLGDGVFGPFRDHADLGDIIGVTGTPFRTKTGEITLRVRTWQLLSKALRPPPEKFHGMTDVEVRYRRREVDLFSNEDVRRRFYARSLVVSRMRTVLDGKRFIEVETPVMQPVAGGALAKPFVTKHEALDMNLFLRVAPELYLKRLIVGGLERVYEIGRAFRNEGIDTRHNPEFTILEAYQAFTDIQGMRDLTEELVSAAAESVYDFLVENGGASASSRDEHGNALFSYRGHSFPLARTSYADRRYPWLSMEELFAEHAKLDFRELCRTNAWRDAARKTGLSVDDAVPDNKCFDRIFDERILPKLPSVTFVHGFPAVFSPLAKCPPDDPHVAERFELFIAHEEVANAYSEQNDPDVQRSHFQEQARQRSAGNEEAMPADEEFLIALEHGMPPAGGLGIGVDRLTMILTGTESIREVILFPLLRPEKAVTGNA